MSSINSAAINSKEIFFDSVNPNSIGAGVDTLEDRLLKVSTEFSADAYVQKVSTMQLLSEAQNTSDPEKLFQAQQSILDYNLEVSLASALTRKAISAVEALLRA